MNLHDFYVFWATIVAGTIFTIALIVLLFIPGDALKLPKSGSMSVSLILNGMISLKVDPDMYEMNNLKSIF